MLKRRHAVIAALVALVVVAGCAAGVSPAPDLGGLYNRAAQAGDVARNRLLDSPRPVAPDHAARALP